MTIEGQLAGDYVQIAKTCCEEAMSLGKRLHIFLRDVSVMDEAGRALLRRLAANGCRLHGIGIYTSYIIRRLTSSNDEGGEPHTRKDDR